MACFRVPVFATNSTHFILTLLLRLPLKFQIGPQMGRKNSKGTVSISRDKNSIRLRWRYLKERFSINLGNYSKINLLKAKKTAIIIEDDLQRGQFDHSLRKYYGDSEEETLIISKSIVQYFEEWTKHYKQMDCEVHCNYHAVRNMLRKWGVVSEKNMLVKFNSEKFCERTYNRRLTMLKSFVKWLVKNSIWKFNPLEDVNPKRCKKVENPTRNPFTRDEITKILNAFYYNTCCPKYSPIKHSFYYPFLYFMFKTGVRNSEAIGLRVNNIDPVNKQITIKEVLARTLKGNSAKQRVRKETKNGKIRIIPLTNDLMQVLNPLLSDKKADDLVFSSPEGTAIDDNNFQTRIFRKVLKELNIPHRVLYACRHTFASRCLEANISPTMTSYLMGNNPETLLRTYAHVIELPQQLPQI